MKTKHAVVKQLLIASLVTATTGGVNAQLLETMGTGSGTQSIATHEADDEFDLDVLTYSGTADMRTTLVSTGYTSASGGYNTLIQAQETFLMQGVNTSTCSAGDSIFFGIYKSTIASNATDYLTLEYSTDNGLNWTGISYPSLPTGSGTAKWHRVGTAIPAGAFSATLWLRFTNTLVGTSSSNPQFRIDDIELTCGSTTNCGSPEASIAVTGSTVYCSGSGSTTLDASTTLSSPSYQWFDQVGTLSIFTSQFSPTTSGTYYVKATDAQGCEATSEAVYIKVYPAPAYCPVSVDGCEGDTLEACVQVAAPDLFFSEYVEGSGFNKYLEIFNGTCGSVDLSFYELQAFHNGAPVTGTPTYTIPLSGTLNSGDVFVVAHPSATAWGGTPDLTSANIQFNGDDALVLVNIDNGLNVDIIGSIGNDPGSAWSDFDTLSSTYGWTTLNKTLVRKACVYAGIDVNPALPGNDGFPTLTTEWDTLSTDDVSGLGAHTFGASAYGFSLASGDATVLSSSDNCVTVIVGRENSTLSIDGTFCTFNDCASADVVEVNNVCGLRQTAVSNGTTSNGISNGTAIFPNPATDLATVSFSTETEGDVAITLTDLSGKEVTVLAATFMRAGKQQVEINLSGFAPGAYICHIITPDTQETIRVIKADK